MYMCASATAINLPSELFNEVQYLHGVCLSRRGLPIGKDSPIVSSQHIYNEIRKTDLSWGDKNQKRSHRIRAVSFCIIFASTNSSLVTQNPWYQFPAHRTQLSTTNVTQMRHEIMKTKRIQIWIYFEFFVWPDSNRNDGEADLIPLLQPTVKG